jgi:ribosomal protein S18 acetylase RimI-like enzyme
MIELRPLEPADLEPLREMFNALVAPAPGWARVEVAQHWISAAHGDRSRVAVRGGRVAGGVGVVVAPPWMYIVPLVADDVEVAAALLAHGIAQATPGVRTTRVSVRRGEEPKRAAVVAAGFAPSLEFVDLVHDLRGGRAADAGAPGLRRVPHAAIDRPRAHELHDRVFAEIANTAPLGRADFDQLLDGPMAWPDATAVWVDDGGRPRGFVFAQRGEDDRGRFGVVDAIGVEPADRGRGLARMMLEDLLAHARAAGLDEVRTLIAGNNDGSLALHRAAGFVEAGRRRMYDLPVTGG